MRIRSKLKGNAIDFRFEEGNKFASVSVITKVIQRFDQTDYLDLAICEAARESAEKMLRARDVKCLKAEAYEYQPASASGL